MSNNEVESQQEGFGLIGLRERVELLGGQVTYGPAEPVGYRVSVQIPVPTTHSSIESAVRMAANERVEQGA